MLPKLAVLQEIVKVHVKSPSLSYSLVMIHRQSRRQLVELCDLVEILRIVGVLMQLLLPTQQVAAGAAAQGAQSSVQSLETRVIKTTQQ